MITQNLHAHSTLDDGQSTPEEMILAAKQAGLTSFGLSLHSPLPFSSSWAVKEERLSCCVEEVRRLGRKYKEEIRVYLGIEWDVLSRVELEPFDYVIGSVHHLPVAGFPAVDESEESTARWLKERFGGDADAAAVLYFEQLSLVAQMPEVDIVGHFDLLTKFEERHAFFKEGSSLYRQAALGAMEKLVRAGKIFEINTGAIARGYRTKPYLSRELLMDLREMGGRVTVSSDAHRASDVNCAFDVAEQLLRDCGFAEIWILEGGQFVPKGF